MTLGELNLTIKSETFHQFMLYVYKNKLRLIDHIKELSFKLDSNNNSIIVNSVYYIVCIGLYEAVQADGRGLSYDAAQVQ